MAPVNATTSPTPTLSKNATQVTKNLVSSTARPVSSTANPSKITSTTPLPPSISTTARIVPNFSTNSTPGLSSATLSVLSSTISAIPASFNSTAIPSVTLQTSTDNHLINNITNTYINNTLKGEPLSRPNDDSSSSMSVFFIALISIGISTLLVLGILMIIRKSRLDRLRHHLMPVYNFDPAEDGEDWETELLDEPFGSSQHSYSTDGANKPIKLDSGLTGGLNVKPGSGSIVKNRPTPSSGLLSDNNNQTNRFLYTNDRPIV